MLEIASPEILTPRTIRTTAKVDPNDLYKKDLQLMQQVRAIYLQCGIQCPIYLGEKLANLLKTFASTKCPMDYRTFRMRLTVRFDILIKLNFTPKQRSVPALLALMHLCLLALIL